MTSLSNQLRDISRPALVTPRHLDSKWQPSYLFEGNQARLVDRETVLALAKNGFEELITLDSSFTEFQRLFKASYIDRDRGLLTTEENDKLTVLLEDLLRRLSPYFPLRPAQKLFEWLITIHKVNHYNMSALLECVFPYYNTNLFVRVLQLLPLADKRSEWHWLKQVQKSKMSLSPLSLVQHAISAPSFLEFICQLFINSIPSNGDTHTSVNFYVSTIVQVVTHEHLLRENLLQTILPSLTEALKSQIDDVFAAGLIVATCLGTSCVLTSELCNPLVKMVCKVYGSLAKESLGCLALLAETQVNFKLAQKCLKSLCNNSESLELLATLDSKYKTEKLSICLLKHCIEVQSESGGGKNALYILENIQFDKGAVNEIFILITDKYLNSTIGEINREFMVEIGRLLANKYPVVIKEVVERMQLEFAEIEDKINHFQNFLIAIYLNWNFTSNSIDCENKLFLSLNHATSNTRRAAVLRIGQQLSTQDTESVNTDFVKSCLLERIRDKSAEVVLAVLEIGTDLFDVIPPFQLVDILLNLCISGIEHVNSKSWRECALASLRLLISDEFMVSAPHIIYAVTLMLIELMFLTTPTIKLNTQVLKIISELTSSPHQSVLYGVKELIVKRKVISFDKNTSVKLLLSFNVSLLNTIAERMTLMEKSSFECFIDFLINSLQNNQHCVISLSLLGLTLDAIKYSNTPFINTIASSFVKLLSETKYFFEILTGDYGNAEKFINTKIQNILIDSTCNPNSGFVKSYAICRLSLWTMSAIVTRSEDSENFCSAYFWREDLSDISDYTRIVFTLTTLLIELDLSISSLQLAYKQILQQLLAIHLNDSTFLSTCIANMLTLPGSDSHRDITSQMKIYALHMFLSFIGSLQETPAFAYIDKLSNNCPILPALLTQLVSENRYIRHLSLQCLTSMRCNSTNSYQPMIAGILDRSIDIRASREFTTRVLSILVSSTVQSGKRRNTRQTHFTESYPLDPILMELVNTSTPNHIISLFLALLQSIDSQHTYIALCSLLERCLKCREAFGDYHSEIIDKLINICTPTIAPLLTKDSKGIEVISLILSSDLHNIHSKLIHKFTPEFFNSLPSNTQAVFLSILFNIVINQTALYLDSTKVTAREVICNLQLNPGLIAHILKHNAEIEINRNDVELTPSPAKKKKRTEPICNGNSLPPQESNQILSSILELLLKCQLRNIEYTIPLYFQILSVLQRWSDVIDSISLDYNNNLLFSLMTNATKQVSPLKLSIFESKFDVLQIIRTIQSSVSVHVQVQGYFLLSEAARLMPDRIIHNIMPIFTFMGSSMVRNDDGYSFQVILQAIETLVPPLINVEGVDKPVISLISTVLQVFVDAFPHIPSHRRLALYAHLTTVLGATQYMYLLVILLLLKDSIDQSSSKAKTSFAKSLLANFDIDTQLSTLLGISRFLDKVVSFNKSTSKSVDYNKNTNMLQDLSEKQILEFSTQIIEFETNYIQNKLFVKKVEYARSGGIEVDEYICEIIEFGLHYFEKNSISGHNTVLIQLLDNAMALLSIEQFVTLFKRIPDQFESSTTDKMLEVLSKRVTSWFERNQLSSHTQLSDLSPLLIRLSCEQLSSVSARKLALHSLKLIVKVLGPDALDKFRKFGKRLMRSVQSDCDDGMFEIIADKLMVMCELVVILNIKLVPNLPGLVPYLIERYNTSISDNISNDTSASGCLSLFAQILSHLANFLNPYLPELISLSIDSTAIMEREELIVLLDTVRCSIAKHVPFRILLSNVITLIPAIETEYDKLTNLLSILEESLLYVDKCELVTSHKALNEILIHTLEFRNNVTTESVDAISQVEEACGNVYVNFVLKLSERVFKPLYLQLREWATNEDSHTQRLIPFYLLSYKLANKLKSIFSIYLIYFVENVVEVLNRTHSDTEPENQIIPEDSNQTSALLNQILKCVETCLKFDQEHVLTREYFDLLKHSLSSQLTNIVGGVTVYQDRVENYLIPCLAQFALRAEHEGMRKELTIEILIISKSSSPKIRFASLLTLDSLFKQLRDDLLQVLPDAVPYLAELLEDESVEVEQQCQVVISTIENILGDSIQQYF
ncbi:HEAT repeat-containing protein 1 [Oopsacas minuta]|uniref:HEAT repeat-containing protein 1 n=1 Tax=Oopsacas minuta TaxID=111878 RepID=A0AAV7JRB5_9METZ|nr:HEAT repeat-containing protein 1 [Oopsacas minuta]